MLKVEALVEFSEEETGIRYRGDLAVKIRFYMGRKGKKKRSNGK